MIQAVVLALFLATPAFSLPTTTQEFITTGIQTPQSTFGNTGFINPQGIITGEKSGAGVVPAVAVQNVEKTQSQGYTELGQTTQQFVGQVYSDTPAQYSELPTGSQAEKTGVQVSSKGDYTSHQQPEKYTQSNVAQTVGNVPSNYEHHQPSQTEIPILLPVQPLTVVPVHQVGEVLRPVVVPAEAVPAGRMFLMAIEPVPQGNFQGVPVIPEKQVPYQQVVPYSNVQTPVVEQTQTHQPYSVQSVEKQGIQSVDQTYTPAQGQYNQESYVREQQVVQNPNVVQQPVEQVQNYNSVPNTQVYNVQQNVQPVLGEYVENQVPQQSIRSTPEQILVAQPVSEQHSYTVQQTAEKQGGVQQVVNYNPTQNQEYQQQEYPVATDNVQRYQSYQQNKDSYQNQPANVIHHEQQIYGQQSAERQTPNPQKNVPVQPLVQEVYVENPQVQVPQQFQPVQQVYNIQPEYVQSYTPVQSESVQQVENVHQTVEKQVPVQQSPQSEQYTQLYQEVPVQQQQVSNVQPFSTNQAETNFQVQQNQPENTHYIAQQQQQKHSPVQSTQQEYVSPPQQTYNFGDRLPQPASVQQNTPVHVLSAVVQNQGQYVNPSVVSPQI